MPDMIYQCAHCCRTFLGTNEGFAACNEHEKECAILAALNAAMEQSGLTFAVTTPDGDRLNAASEIRNVLNAVVHDGPLRSHWFKAPNEVVMPPFDQRGIEPVSVPSDIQPNKE